jgi:Protein of unknown function (DUF2878)
MASAALGIRGGHVTNFLSLGIGWFACVAGAANGTPSYGIAVAAMLLALNILIAEDPIHEARVIVEVGAIGFLIDTTLALAGIFVFHPGTIDPRCPIWLVALWMMFGSTLTASLAWLSARVAVASITGAIAAPLSYLAASRMGAFAIPGLIAPRLVIIAIVWAVVFPGLLKIANRRETSTI